MNIKKNDTVVVLSGKDKGKKGKVLEAMPASDKVVIEGINVATCHVKPKKQGDQGGIVNREIPMYASKVMLVCPKCGKARLPCFVFYDQYNLVQTLLQPMLQVIFTFCIGIINKYYNVKLGNISKKLSLLFMNYGNLITRIKIHLAQCMETRFAKDVFCQK